MSRAETTAGRSSDHRLDNRIARLLFADRWGLVLFFGTVAFVGLYWRVGVFINDTQTIVATLEAVSRGQLHLDGVAGRTFAAPGAVVADGHIYGRNYAHVAFALPFLWAIEGLSAIVNLRVGLVALWHVCLLGLVVHVRRLLDAYWRIEFVGSVLVLGSFLLNLVLIRQFADVSRFLVALHVSTILAAGLLAVLTYRVVAYRHTIRVAVLAGGAASIVLPVGFWAPLPKRHVLTAALLMGILLAFDRSRADRGGIDAPVVGRVPLYRAAAYGLVGLLAWLHAGEALFVLIALAIVDVPTAPRNDARTVMFLVATFAVSLLPFFVTNGLISGDILQPPRTLPPADTTNVGSADFLQTPSGQGSTSGSSTFPGYFIVEELMWLLALVATQIDHSLTRLADLDAVVHTWIRSGSLESVAEGGLPEFRAVNLSVLESVPLLGAMVAVFTAAIGSPRAGVRGRIHPTDILAGAMTIAFVLLYMQSLPVHVQVTVRYLLPIYPLLLYLLVRTSLIRGLLEHHAGHTLWTYAGVVLLGSQLILAYVVGTGLTVSEAAQVHAVLGLGAAAILGASTLAAQFDHRFRTLAAIALGVAAGLGTAFILLTGLAYFSFVGEYVLPMSQAVADLVGRI